MTQHVRCSGSSDRHVGRGRAGRWSCKLRLQRRDAEFQRLVFLARQPSHVLDRLEFLALDDIEIAQDFFGLVAHHRVDLALDALRRARSVVHQAADLVEKPVAGLGHRKASARVCPRQWRSRPHSARAAPRKDGRLSGCDSSAIVISGPGSTTTHRNSIAMIDQQIDISTKDGKSTTFISHPERGGPFPIIIFYMDAPAIREELRDMARRLATSGYYVMLPNMYYRKGVMELGPLPADPESPERKRMFELMHSLSIPLVMDDTRALLDFAATQPAASKGLIGTVGYCMSGQYAINAATHFPERVKAAASIYGVALATDKPDSPHLAGKKTKAELYFGCAETDVYAPMETIEKARQSMQADGANAEVEVYPGTHHGFAFPKRPVYDKDAAERHWERLLALYRRNLS